jgi:hypothetical protein
VTLNEIRALNPGQVGEQIGWPLCDWAGNCSDIARLIIEYEIVPGTHRYGHYLGPIEPASRFYNRHAPFVQHGWIETPEGWVADPLRWEFEGKQPYMFATDRLVWVAQYDISGNKFRSLMLKPCPAVDTEAEVKHPLPTGKAYWWCLAQIPNAMEDLIDEVNPEVVWWFATLPPGFMGEHAKDVYRWIVECGHGAFIPIDNKKLILG